MFHLETLTITYTKAQGGASNAVFSIPSITGYTPMGIVGAFSGSNHAHIYEMRMTSNSSARISVQDDGSAAASVTAVISVLYIRNS